jgi:hypothetical protein
VREWFNERLEARTVVLALVATLIVCASVGLRSCRYVGEGLVPCPPVQALTDMRR